MAFFGNRGRNHSRRKNEIRGHKVLRKQSKAYDKKLALEASNTTSLQETPCLPPSEFENQKIHAPAEESPHQSALNERFQRLLKLKAPSQRISFGVSHRKTTSK
jgi:hypothetical protein